MTHIFQCVYSIVAYILPVNEIPELHNGNRLPVVYEFERQCDTESNKVRKQTESVRSSMNLLSINFFFKFSTENNAMKCTKERR